MIRAPGLAGLCIGLLSTALTGQSVRIATWGSYEAITGKEDWSTFGAQMTWTGARGHGLWGAVELVSRFGLHDGAQRIGGVWHPAPAWWATLEAGTAIGPELVPKNSWEVDVTRLIAPRATAGLGYQRRNYVVGAVDLLVPHAAFPTGRTSWEVRLFLARTPARSTDATVLVRAAHPFTPRLTGVAGAAAGRESYLVGTPPTQQLRSLRTTTGSAGVRLILGRSTTARLDLMITDSDQGLSRRGAALGVERAF